MGGISDRHHHLRNKRHELPAPLANVAHLLAHFFLDIPRQNDQVIRFGGSNHLWMQDRDMRAREKMPLFVGAAVDRIVEKIGAHPQVIEQGVALRRGPVAGEMFLVLFRLQEKFQAPAFDRFDLKTQN